MRYFAQSPQSIEEMLAVINKPTINELFNSIPTADRLNRPLALPPPLDERSLKHELGAWLAPCELVSFLGGGATAHFIPEWVSQQLLRAEWYTSYTPYQPEVSQGTLQALFEFQTMVSALLGLPVANASMYDGATALVEALLMAHRINQRRKVVVASTVHPEYRAVLKTYLDFFGIEVIELGFNAEGVSDLQELSSVLENSGSDIAAVAVQSPNFFGQLEPTREIFALAKKSQALSVACTTDISALALISSPGQLGADIAVGEGLGLCGPVSMGGPGVGLFAAQKMYLRQMPGRLVGKTTDKTGQPGYVLTLSTREQHIRREKATSNICTNHSLMALGLTMTLCAYGKTGFLKLAQRNLQKTMYFRRLAQKNGLKIPFAGPHYNETVVEFNSAAHMRDCLARARQQKILAGIKLETFYPKLSRHLLLATSELVTDHHIEQLADIFKGA
jgi:glycine dehydrogenase subunit 1